MRLKHVQYHLSDYGISLPVPTVTSIFMAVFRFFADPQGFFLFSHVRDALSRGPKMYLGRLKWELFKSTEPVSAVVSDSLNETAQKMSIHTSYILRVFKPVLSTVFSVLYLMCNFRDTQEVIKSYLTFCAHVLDRILPANIRLFFNDIC